MTFTFRIRTNTVSANAPQNLNPPRPVQFPREPRLHSDRAKPVQRLGGDSRNARIARWQPTSATAERRASSQNEKPRGTCAPRCFLLLQAKPERFTSV